MNNSIKILIDSFFYNIFRTIFIFIIIFLWSVLFKKIGLEVLSHNYGIKCCSINIFNEIYYNILRGETYPLTLFLSGFLAIILWLIGIIYLVYERDILLFYLLYQILFRLYISILKPYQLKLSQWIVLCFKFFFNKKRDISRDSFVKYFSHNLETDYGKEVQQSSTNLERVSDRLPVSTNEFINETSPPRMITEAVLIARAMAVFEVWQDPPPQWMIDVLKENLEQLSSEGLILLDALGDKGRLLLKIADQWGVKVTGLTIKTNQESVEVNHNEVKSYKPASLTLTAALLTELLENYLSLLKTEPSSEEEIKNHRKILQESRDDLLKRLSQMEANDWKSLDQFPSLAQHIRISTDHVLELFKNSTKVSKIENNIS
jgi:hypothetical protein